MSFWIARADRTLSEEIPAPPDQVRDFYVDLDNIKVVHPLVVSVQTAVVHLAGALGRPVWALIPAAPEWRYAMEGDAMPWYPSARLVRQAVPDDWGPVVREVAARLAGASE